MLKGSQRKANIAPDTIKPISNTMRFCIKEKTRQACPSWGPNGGITNKSVAPKLLSGTPLAPQTAPQRPQEDAETISIELLADLI